MRTRGAGLRAPCLLGAVLAAGCALQEEERTYSRSIESTARTQRTGTALSPQPASAALSRPTIQFSEFYTYGSGAPLPRPKLVALSGKKVTLVGYMALMEESSPRGGFYLAPHPAVCGGSRARRGGLPPPSVLVLSPAAGGRQVDFVEGTLEVTGILHVGKKDPKERTDGEDAAIRLVLDDPKAFRRAKTRVSERAPRPRGKLAGKTALASSAGTRS